MDKKTNNEYMLTTIDNPFNPFTNYDEWYSYDVEKGYNTCSYLARIAMTSTLLSDEDNFDEIDEAMNKIIQIDPFGVYLKVTKDDKIYKKS